MKINRIASVHKDCVACGSCIKVCKLAAIIIEYGVRAVVDDDKCVGCAMCSKVCPAGVIDIIERGELHG
ncbi:MAG: 4Fe-4S binding protein [Anaerovoracaceae bacterium]